MSGIPVGGEAMTIKAVLFDLGGTLLHYHDRQETDPRRPFRRVTQMGIQVLYKHLAVNGFDLPAMEELGQNIDRHIKLAYLESEQHQHGATIEKPMRAALAEAGINLSDAQWVEARLAFYTPVDEVVFPRDGLRPTLRTLQENGYKLGIISNTFWAADLHDRHLSRFDVLGFFPLRVYSCNSPYIKPHPAIFTGALGKLEVEPGESVFVGDRLDADILGAQGVGMHGVLIHSPYHTDETGDIIPDARIDELPDLIPVLDRFREES